MGMEIESSGELRVDPPLGEAAARELSKLFNSRWCAAGRMSSEAAWALASGDGAVPEGFNVPLGAPGLSCPLEVDASGSSLRFAAGSKAYAAPGEWLLWGMDRASELGAKVFSGEVLVRFGEGSVGNVGLRPMRPDGSGWALAERDVGPPGSEAGLAVVGRHASFVALVRTAAARMWARGLELVGSVFEPAVRGFEESSAALREASAERSRKRALDRISSLLMKGEVRDGPYASAARELSGSRFSWSAKVKDVATGDFVEPKMEGGTLIHLAALFTNPGLLGAALDAGTDPGVRDRAGRLAWQVGERMAPRGMSAWAATRFMEALRDLCEAPVRSPGGMR